MSLVNIDLSDEAIRDAGNLLRQFFAFFRLSWLIGPAAFYRVWDYSIDFSSEVTIRPLYFCEECGAELPWAEDDENPEFFPWCSITCAENAFAAHMIF